MTCSFTQLCSQVALDLFRAIDGDRLTRMSTDDLKRLRDAVWPPDEVIDGIFREEVDAELSRRGETLYCETVSDTFSKRVERAQDDLRCRTANHFGSGAPEFLMHPIGWRVGTPCVPSGTTESLSPLAPD
jgi:hypothetical protein